MKKKYMIVVFNVILGLIVLFFYSNYKKAYTLKEYSPDIKHEKEISEYVIKNGESVLHDKLVRYNEKGNEVVEERIDNFPSGKIMRYTSYDDSGIQAFTILYDEKGNVENFKGHPLIETYQNKIASKRRLKEDVNQYLKVGDTLKHHYLIANIPNAKRTLKIENIDNTNAKRTLKKTSQIGIEVKEVLIKKGINTIQTVVNYKFNDKEKTSITYTESFEVEVH
ncbi:hypothetical protein OIU80_04025 [Flavobacterium sp. LS1R47]|uniref:Uncharacterized protein n=1 Tax=Flavobacterium frigoritolerans TaxID=2987686 RepID=A0A9X3C8I2_9FLAO|nr:hypothetical protein [Flavobacterium frigoritolerans]MCV9931438.1 hypothetical protein [Flavobacterium frigoritolerans]